MLEVVKEIPSNSRRKKDGRSEMPAVIKVLTFTLSFSIKLHSKSFCNKPNFFCLNDFIALITVSEFLIKKIYSSRNLHIFSLIIRVLNLSTPNTEIIQKHEISF